ncbi:MAG: hypothetical protein QM764_05910 [Chitinophagaceae bacterium]
MLQRLSYFVVVLLLIFSKDAFSQQATPVAIQNISIKTVYQIKNDSLKLNTIEQDFYSKHLGFFCKKELQIEKATSIPFRLRLGSLDYVNYLERKPNAVKP